MIVWTENVMPTFFPETTQSQYPWVRFLQKNADYFGLKLVSNTESLGNVRRTGFTWAKNSFTLCLAANKHYIDQAINNPSISGVITHSRFASKLTHSPDRLIICCDQPAELFYAIHNIGIHKTFPGSNDQKTSIATSAKIASSAIIHEGVVIGERVNIHDGVIILSGSVIGDDTDIHPGVTIGTVGFFSKTIFGKKTQVEHFGGVSIGANCIVHARCNISRSANHAESTTIEDDVHIGIGANIAHDCTVGQWADVSARVVLAGRVCVGKRCWIGAGVLISNALTIGDDASVKIGSVVVTDVAEKMTVSGNFAINHKRQLKNFLSKV